jgi:hypothetical protein
MQAGIQQGRDTWAVNCRKKNPRRSERPGVKHGDS